jgi:hypothetical protein
MRNSLDRQFRGRRVGPRVSTGEPNRSANSVVTVETAWIVAFKAFCVQFVAGEKDTVRYVGPPFVTKRKWFKKFAAPTCLISSRPIHHRGKKTSAAFGETVEVEGVGYLPRGQNE